jgi:hypothetical protein
MNRSAKFPLAVTLSPTTEREKPCQPVRTNCQAAEAEGRYARRHSAILQEWGRISMKGQYGVANIAALYPAFRLCTSGNPHPWCYRRFC